MNVKPGEQYNGPYTATDAIIEYEKNGKYGIILIERKYPPKKIALPGGFQEPGLSLGENCIKECKEETGLDVIVRDETRPFRVNSRPDRDPRGNVISVTYIVQGKGEIKPDEKEDAKRAWLCTYRQLEKLFDKDLFAFDHEYIIKQYLEEKRL